MIPIHEPRKGLSLSIRIQVQEGGLEIFPRGTGLDRENGGEEYTHVSPISR